MLHHVKCRLLVELGLKNLEIGVKTFQSRVSHEFTQFRKALLIICTFSVKIITGAKHNNQLVAMTITIKIVHG